MRGGNKCIDRVIALVDQYPFLGGGQVVLLEVGSSALRRVGKIVIAAPGGGALEQVARHKFGSALTWVPILEPKLSHGHKGVGDALRLLVYSVSFALRMTVVFRGVDLVYGNGPRQFPGLMVAAMLTGRRCCYHVHIDHTYLEKRLLGVAARLSSTFRIILNSTFVYQRLVDVIPSLAENPRVIVVENGLSPQFSSRRPVNRFVQENEGINVVVLGVIRPEKGQDLAVALARRESRIQLHVIGRIGEGAEDWAAALIADAPSNVVFHEAVEDVPLKLDTLNAHINLVPSRWNEPFGLAAIEGMACSCITVVSDRGALPDIAKHTGAIIADGLENLVREIDGLLSRPSAELNDLARHQFHATMERYSNSAFAARIGAVLGAGLDT